MAGDDDTVDQYSEVEDKRLKMHDALVEWADLVLSVGNQNYSPDMLVKNLVQELLFAVVELLEPQQLLRCCLFSVFLAARPNVQEDGSICNCLAHTFL